MTDPHFDRVLRAAARRGRPVEPCPEPALLAAYADRSLSAPEREAIELHIADCAACMERLALLAAVDAPEEPAVPVVTWNPARVLKHLGWLAPVATAVLVAAVWLRAPAPGPPADVLRQQAKQEAPGQSAEGDARRRNEAPSIGQSAASPSGQEPPARAKTKDIDAFGAAKKTPAAPVASREAGAPASQAEDKLTRRDADLSDEREGARLQTAERQPRAMAEAAAAAPAAGAPAAPPAPAMPKADRPANRPDAGVTGNVMAKALTANLIVGGPDQVRVRLDRQRLERSVDGGLSWTLERQDVQDALSAGACPSDQVCWLAGSNATWVRDASGAWTRQAMPAGARATAVSAADALHAVVTRADGSRLETADGGVTWTAVLVP